MEDGNSVGDVPDIPRRNEVSMTIPSLWSIASMIEPCLQSQSCASGTVVFSLCRTSIVSHPGNYFAGIYVRLGSIDKILVRPVGFLHDVLSFADYPIARAVPFHAVPARLILRSSPLLRLISIR
jgi:hypothetical protein